MFQHGTKCEGGLRYTNTTLRYAMHGKWNVLIAGGVFQQTGGATLLLPLHSNIFLRLLLNINGNFGWCSRSCHYSCFREALVKLDIHSKYFCLHSARLLFFSSWVLRHSCQFPGLYGVVANGTDAVYCEYQGVMWWPEMTITTLFQPSSCFLRRPLCNNTPPFSHTHILFNRISITITICTVEAVLPNGVQTHTSSRFPR